MAINVKQINGNKPYDLKDEQLLDTSLDSTVFDPSVNYIEYTISSPDKSFSFTDTEFSSYAFPKSGVTSDFISNIVIDPESDILRFNNSISDVAATYIVKYNFLQNELDSSPNNPKFYIKSISSDRTEVTLGYTEKAIYVIDEVNYFKDKLNFNFVYFQDFYLNFGDDNLCVANNIAINSSSDIIINLYKALPNNIGLKDTLWVVTQIADPLEFQIDVIPNEVSISYGSYPIKGPNLNISSKDKINNSTGFETYSTLITSSLLSPSYSQLNNLISSSGIEIGIDYTDFSNFIHFSSAVSRINNFYYKKQLIDQYQNEINILNNITSLVTSSNINLLTNKINSIIENFDGYEYFLYYGSGSWSYPKSGSTIPYTLQLAGTSEVLNWLGDADNLTGILGSASLYDKNNLDYLYNTVPLFIQEDSQNDPYKSFVEMVAQHYDNIWVYYKDVTNRYNADNRLDYGISKDLVAEALKSFGVKIYQNNFTSNDLYSSFLGYGATSSEMTGSLPITTGSFQEYINNYITASYDASVMPLDDYNKEVYKRIYHNIPYLAKTKGTIPGLRALINCFGVPDTILRISEFGGRDKDTSTYDYFDNKFNYAYYMTSPRSAMSSSFQINDKFGGASGKQPKAIQFRFKPDLGTSFNFAASQSLVYLSSPLATSPYVSSSALAIRYKESGSYSGSYSGSVRSNTYQYADLCFYPDVNKLETSASVTQPFFNGDWWSVMLTYDSTGGGDAIYNLYVGSKGYYDGYDGNQVLYYDSSSLTVTPVPALGYDYRFLSKSQIGYGFTGNALTTPVTFDGYTGYIQELRYWGESPNENAFKDFIMNPSSIDYWGEENEYVNYLAFRNSLGNELYTGSKSIHPKITGSWTITQSFNEGNSDFYINNCNIYSNVEPFLYNQPIAGIRNRVTDKIQIVSSSYPTGSVLSQYRSLEQIYPTLGSETPDINLLEVALSPQNEINNDIISSLGYFNIGDYIGDPRQISLPNYPDLDKLSNDFFQKYFASYDLFDYIRLIKYFDNSLFKMIQDFVPARTSLTSGIVVKQHLLERNRYPEPQVEWEFEDYSGSLTTAFIDSGTGGTFDSYNFIGSTIPPTFINNTQSWGEEIKTPVGLLTISHSTQDEFYNGELPNSIIITTNGELNPDNLFKQPSTKTIVYNPILYKSNITPMSNFINPNTSPNPGEIYLWWDSGSITNPGSSVLSTTNGVKYIKLNIIDSGGLDQSQYLSQLQTLTLTYPDRTPVIYNIAGVQNVGSYFLYNIGPYTPGSINNFNTSSAGDINDYSLIASTSSITIPNGGSTIISNYDSSTNPNGYFTASSGVYTWYQTPNPYLIFEFTASGVSMPSSLAQDNSFDLKVNGITLINQGFQADTTSRNYSGSFVIQPIETQQYSFGIFHDADSGNPSLNVSTLTIKITQTTSEFNGSSSLTLFNPSSINFDYNNYNALLDNAEIPQSSVFYMDIDYSQNPLIPVNQSLILNGEADRAQIQDSNYSSKSWSNIRYNGSKYNSIIIKTL